MKTHWRALSNPDYIGAYAFQPGEEKTVTISTVGIETVTGPDGHKEQCTVLHFMGDVKPLILNVTNSKMITKVLQTPYIEDWAGKSIVLGVETVSAFGERVDAVRVRKKQAQQAACADCGQIITAAGRFTADQIARATQNQYGRALCTDCAKNEKERRSAEQEEKDAKAGL